MCNYVYTTMCVYPLRPPPEPEYSAEDESRALSCVSGSSGIAVQKVALFRFEPRTRPLSTPELVLDNPDQS